MRHISLIGLVAFALLLAGCSQSYPTAPGDGGGDDISLKNTSIGIEDNIGTTVNPDEQGQGSADIGNTDGWGDHNGELEFLTIEIEYINPYFYTAEGYPGYYIGLPMCYQVKITNTGNRIYSDIDVKGTTEYYETHTSDRWWYPDENGNTLIDVEKGEALPGETEKVWWEVDFLPGETVTLEFCYTPGWETVDGLDQIHIELRHHNAGPWHAAKFYDNPEQSIFCPPPPPQ